MSSSGTSRRQFLIRSVSGMGAAWIAAHYAEIEAAAAYVQGTPPAAFAFFTPAQAADVEAMTAQIIPSDDTPGARQANVVHFIDRALTTFESGRQADYARGLVDLQAETKKQFPAASAFSALTADQQIAVLTAIEQTPFFTLVRTHTITGFFASPVHGGNAGKVGWTLVGYDDSLEHTPPFGYYDALPEVRG